MSTDRCVMAEAPTLRIALPDVDLATVRDRLQDTVRKTDIVHTVTRKAGDMVKMKVTCSFSITSTARCACAAWMPAMGQLTCFARY